MKRSSIRLHFMAGSALVAIAAPFAVSTAAAQSAGEQASASMEEIVVTGTRIRRPNLESNSPLTVVSDSEIKYQGATNVDSVLNRMPQFTPDANENVSNGADGTAQINLRDLGSNRVLVLMDGQRLLPSQAMDVNFIPSALVERIDVVTGGASAVYGSDAISGVVNFIMRKNLNGIRADAQYSFYQHNNNNDSLRDLVRDSGYETAPGSVTDGSKYDINIAAGTDFADGKGNVTMYAGYRKVRPVLQGSRDYSACALDPTGEGNSAFACGGSSNNEYGSFTVLKDPVTGSPVNYNNTKDGSKTWVPYDSSFRFNYAPENYIQRSDIRYTAGAFAHYELAPSAEVYGSFMFMDDHSYSQAASGGLWAGEVYSINCDNPLLGAQQATALCGAAAGTDTSRDTFIGYRLTGEGSSPRRDSLRHTNYRFTGGVRGDIFDGISYDVGALRAVSIFNENYQNDVDPAKAKKALQVVNVDGVPTCKSVIDGTDPNCVPMDVFGYGNIDPSAYDYIYAPTFTRGEQTLTMFSANISGDLTNYGIVSPWASSGVGFALGVEHRRENLVFEADALAQAKGTLESQGSIKVNEVYAEVGVPILENMPFARSLSITGGFRYSEYTNDSKTGTVTKYSASTYKGELDYAPSRDVRFRASYNHAIRAPNINELFASQGLGNVSAQDPCAGTSPVASMEQCQLTGVSPEQYGNIPECPANMCVAQGGGNPLLKPEEADTYTFGVVLTPTFLPNLSLSLDYYNIKVDGYIGSVDPTLTINQCVQTGNPYFCDLFHRAPGTGVLFGTDGYVVGTTLNTGYLKTSGIDVSANYRFDFEDVGLNNAGRLNFDLVGTYLDKSTVKQLPGLGTYDCAGLYGPTCGQPTPRWRHNLRTTWEMPWSNATLSLNWRYFGGTKLSSNTDNEFLKGTPYIINRKLKAYSYFDLSGTVEVYQNLVLRAGINNLFDKDPPAIAQGLLSSFGNGNTYPGVYDPLGRTIFVGLTAEF
ncbi:TonB-dependent receptor domain-containing protein [Pedomonas mirosovicensis]|uniref:TonB-dependent receptor domain-containing protein n=1 Tax=Pedomonas mirosovicensis TaxID=2908641 RepID=UPI00216A05F0|nr:TonB-dependent receptor [Pedomonas mirosovicensis]MCH8686168.1 TonB-dependent receptor [Pedomonas mirosovicensis]